MVLGEKTNEVHRSMREAKFPRKNQLKAKRRVPADTAKDFSKPEHIESRYSRKSLFESRVGDWDSRRLVGQGKVQAGDVMNAVGLQTS